MSLLHRPLFHSVPINKRLFYWVQFEVEKQMFSIPPTKRRQNETEIIEMDHSFVASFVRVPPNRSQMYVITYRQPRKGSSFECLRQMMIWNRVNWIRELFEGFAGGRRGWKLEKSGASPTRVAQISCVTAPHSKVSQARSFANSNASPVPFYFQILHINTQLPASCLLPCRPRRNYVRLIQFRALEAIFRL